MNCPPPDELLDFAFGRQTALDVDALERHVVECDACVTQLEKLVADGSWLELLPAAGERPLPADNEWCPLYDRVVQFPSWVPTLSGGDDATVTSVARRVEAEWKPVLAPAESADELGRFGEYRVLRVLGQGGMGIVLLAEDLNLDRLVALKIMRPALALVPEIVVRFQREARAMARLKSEYVATIFAVGEVKTVLGAIPYLSMQLLEGETLEERLRDGRLSWREAVAIARQAAEGLAAAHEQGLVHRDVKPGNTWLLPADEAGGGVRVKLLDFGLAQLPFLEGPTLTRFGTVLGTPAYMSPEQGSGQETDARSDLFSLGIVLHEMITGERPFRGHAPLAILQATVSETPVAVKSLVPEVPQELSLLIDRLLAKSPQHRPQTARELSQALQAIETNPRYEVRPKSSIRSRHGWIPAVIAGLAAMLGACIVIFVVSDQGDLVIHAPEDGVRVTVQRNGQFVRHMSLKIGENVTHVYSGDVEVLLADAGARAFTISPGRIELHRGQRKSVVIHKTAEGRGSAPEVTPRLTVDEPAADPPLASRAPSAAVAAAQVRGENRSSEPSRQVDEKIPDPWQPLFNGHDLTGWKTHPDQPAGWKVEEGMLIGFGAEPAHLFTQRDDYRDVHVRVEVRMRGNCGLFVRTPFAFTDSRREFVTGYESELFGGAGFAYNGTIYAKLKVIQWASALPHQPSAWMTLEFIVEGDRLRSLIDGVEVATCQDTGRSYSAGHITLQKGPQAHLEIRQLDVKELTPRTSPSPAS